MSSSFCAACSSFLHPSRACSSHGSPSSPKPASRARKFLFIGGKDRHEDSIHSTPAPPALKRRTSKWSVLRQQSSQSTLPRYFSDAVENEPASYDPTTQTFAGVTNLPRSQTAPPPSLTALASLFRPKTPSGRSASQRDPHKTPHRTPQPSPSQLDGLADYKALEGGKPSGGQTRSMEPLGYFDIPRRGNSAPLISSPHTGGGSLTPELSLATLKSFEHLTAVTPETEYGDIHPALRPRQSQEWQPAELKIDTTALVTAHARKESRPQMTSSVLTPDDMPSALDFGAARAILEAREAAVEVDAESPERGVAELDATAAEITVRLMLAPDR